METEAPKSATYEATKELLVSLKEDTSKVSELNVNELYSIQLKSGTEVTCTTTFDEMGLKDEILQSIYRLSYEKPSPIQNIAIPHILKGNSVAFHSKSGTGKTVAFTLGALNKAEKGKGPQIIILTPTRELNTQVGEVVLQIAGSMGISVCVAQRNFVSEEINEEIVVGCPGKIFGLINSGVIKKDDISMIVFDEADILISQQSFSMHTISLLKKLGASQKIFFSATYSEFSQKALKKLVPDCDTFFEKNVKADKIQLYNIQVPGNKRVAALKDFFTYLTIAQTIIFVGTKHGVDSIAEALVKDGFSVSKIHGGMSIEERDESYSLFYNAKTKILVSTDVFSRGMDIPQVNLIINYDLPSHSEESLKECYIHRIGRSGRFDRVGFVVDFVKDDAD
ncbi:ATP-dependent RNA helicase, partial [Enteropsectra breve]